MAIVAGGQDQHVALDVAGVEVGPAGGGRAGVVELLEAHAGEHGVVHGGDGRRGGAHIHGHVAVAHDVAEEGLVDHHVLGELEDDVVVAAVVVDGVGGAAAALAAVGDPEAGVVSAQPGLLPGVAALRAAPGVGLHGDATGAVAAGVAVGAVDRGVAGEVDRGGGAQDAQGLDGAVGLVQPRLAGLEHVVAIVARHVCDLAVGDGHVVGGVGRRAVVIHEGEVGLGKVDIAGVGELVGPGHRRAGGQHRHARAIGRVLVVVIRRGRVGVGRTTGGLLEVDPGIEYVYTRVDGRVVLARTEGDDLALAVGAGVGVDGVVGAGVPHGEGRARRFAERHLVLHAGRQVVELVVAVDVGAGDGRGVAHAVDDAVGAAAGQGHQHAADARLATVLQAVAVGVEPDEVTQRLRRRSRRVARRVGVGRHDAQRRTGCGADVGDIHSRGVGELGAAVDPDLVEVEQAVVVGVAALEAQPGEAVVAHGHPFERDIAGVADLVPELGRAAQRDEGAGAGGVGVEPRGGDRGPAACGGAEVGTQLVLHHELVLDRLDLVQVAA